MGARSERYVMRTLLIGLVLLLGACATQFTTDQNMAITCRGYSSTLNAMIPFKSQMSEAQKDGIKQGISVISPLCRAAARGELDAFDLQDALTVLRTELRNLLVVEQEVTP